MVDHPITERAERTDSLVSLLRRERSVLIGFLVVSLAAVAWLAWRVFGVDPLGDPLATSLAAFEKQNQLVVFSAQLAPVVASDDERMLGMLKSKQVAIIPARVDYRVDLTQIDGDRLQWNDQSRTLSVALPPLQVGRPNLDEGRAQYLREGVWITREAQERLNRNNTQLAERQAAQQARNEALLTLAKSAAKDAVRQNLAIPLEVAGYDNVTVEVRFDDEKEAE